VYWNIWCKWDDGHRTNQWNGVSYGPGNVTVPVYRYIPCDRELEFTFSTTTGAHSNLFTWVS
jgi:hypothetical protein